jgi:hypothetical protein
MAGVPVRSFQQRRGLRTGQFAVNTGEMRVSPQRRFHGFRCIPIYRGRRFDAEIIELCVRW